MVEKYPLSDQQIIGCLNIDYGIKVATLKRLPIGADVDAAIYKAQTEDLRSYFLKLRRGQHRDIGALIVELLQDAGIEGIISPIKTLASQSTKRVEDCTLTLYPFIEGRDGFHSNLTDHQWVQLGSSLWQVHEMDVPPSIQSQLRRENYSPKWREAVRALYPYMETKPTGDEIALKLWKFMKGHMLAIRRLVDHAEELAQKLQGQSAKFVLCHSDIHGGNVLIGEDDALYIVDWDDPMMAPKERDLMFIGGGVGNIWNKPHEEEAFYRGYGKVDLNSIILAYYRHERIVEDIAIYGHEILLASGEGEDRARMYKDFIDMFKPRGVVEIALETDEGLTS